MKTLGRSGDLDQVVSKYTESGSEGRVLDLGVTQSNGFDPEPSRRAGIHDKFDGIESREKFTSWRQKPKRESLMTMEDGECCELRVSKKIWNHDISKELRVPKL